ncbi:MAG: hypothetical protein PF495_10965, partial [Spirochaetales bacterium]|nr:hypothetical protein [Spirochaetales bacterium]
MRYFSTITLLILTFFFSGAVLLSAEGTLVLVSESPNAGWKVLLDREQHDFYQGVEFHLEPGVHRLEAEVSGYQRIDRPIRISDRESLTVELELIPQSALAVRPDLRETAVEYTG